MKIKNVFYVVTVLAIMNSNIHTMSIDEQLLIAVKDGQTEQVRTLLADGADVNSTNERGWTALHSATMRSYTEIVQLLLANGADPDRKNLKNETSLFWAANDGNIAIVKLLLEHNANQNIASTDGYTPLSQARDEQIITMLLLAKPKLLYNMSPEQIALLDKVTQKINNRTEMTFIGWRQAQAIWEQANKISPSFLLASRLFNMTIPTELLPLPSEILKAGEHLPRY